MQPPLFKKESTSEPPKQNGVTEFYNKLGLSQSLMVQEGIRNLNVTLKGYPKKFWGLFGQKAHKHTANHTISPQKSRFIINPNKPRIDLQP